MNSMNAYDLFTFLNVVLEGWRNCMNICHYWNDCIMFGLGGRSSGGNQGHPCFSPDFSKLDRCNAGRL